MNGDPHLANDAKSFLQTAYRDHGYAPLQQEQKEGRSAVVSRYPCSLQVLRQATGVLLHSRFAREVLLQHYGPEITSQTQLIPFMRRPLDLPGREEARIRLGIAHDAFLICSFGFLGPTKLSHCLLSAWEHSKLCHTPGRLLRFVGAPPQNSYGTGLLERIRELNTRTADITITGFIPLETYRDYLAAADAAVQLRENSRGETSAAVYDCLAAGLLLICNAHGSMTELPEECVTMLPEHFEDHQLTQTLEQLPGNPAVARHQAQLAADWLQQEHHPALVGLRYCQAIEQFAAKSPRNHEQYLQDQLPAPLLQEQQTGLIDCLTANNPRYGLRQLLLDISAIARHDLKTGIERAVRSIMRELLDSPPDGYRIEPVYFNEQGGYSYARRFTLQTMGLDPELLQDEPVQAHSGDLFLGADLILADLHKVETCLRSWRMGGVIISFIVYDLLPIQRPDCFPASVEPAFRNWLRIVSTVADNLICISQSVADELREHFRHNPPQRRLPLQVGYFHLGADIRASLPTSGLLPDTEQILQAISDAPAFLMVSTIEPRKGHTQALDAFELLWRQGMAANLVIVGKPGWMTENLIKRLDSHPELGKQLFCLYSISDQMLELVYQHCSCLLAPSEGEGFGLPLIETAQHGLPLIVRDIPVFYEVAGDHATYFSGKRSKDLAEAIRAWLLLPAADRPTSIGMAWLTWQQSVQQLLTQTGCGETARKPD
jgi:glycosyltransferase involved in cell wall biosynthesis